MGRLDGPGLSLLQVTAAFVLALANPDFLVEMDAIAVVPEDQPR